MDRHSHGELFNKSNRLPILRFTQNSYETPQPSS
jgi:hypothetical protein